MTTVNQVFESAPMGRRVVLATALSAAAFLFGIGINLYFAVPKMGPQMPVGKKMAVIVAPVFSALVGVVVFMQQRSKVARFKIEENVLVVRKKRYPLEHLVEAARDPEVLKGARRCWGNSGLGVIRRLLAGEPVAQADSGLAPREWRELMATLGRTDS